MLSRANLLSLAAGALVVLLAVFIVAYYRAASDFAGYWTGEASWLAEAGLSGALLHLRREGGGWLPAGRYAGLLLLVDEAGQPVACEDLSVARDSFAFELAGHLATRRPCRAGAAVAGCDLWPERVRLALDTRRGTLTVYDSERVYAHLVRDATANALG